MKIYRNLTAPAPLKILVSSAALALILLTAFACARTESEASGTAEPPTARPSPPSLSVGGVLRVAVPEYPEHLDPHHTTSTSALDWVIGLVYSRLFEYSVSETQTESGQLISSRQVECDLCSSWERIDDTTFLLTIRENAHWHDIAPLSGRAVTATDVVMSIQRQQTTGNISAFLVQNIRQIEALDAQTLRLTLTTPDPELFQKLAHPASSIVPPELYQSETGTLSVRDTAIGSGPWQLTEVGSTYDLVANPDYFEFDADGHRLPYLSEIELQFVDSTDARSDGVLVDTVQVADIQHSYITSTLAIDPTLRIIGVTDHSMGAELLLNTTHPDLKDPTVRRALWLTWDIPSWVTTIWGADARPSYGLTPPSPAPSPATELLTAFGNTAEANRLLTASGFNPSTPLTVTVGDFGDEYIDLGTLMVTALQQLGIPADLNVIPTYQFAEEVWLAADFDIAVGAAAPLFSTADKLLTFHHSDGVLNHTGYSTPQLDSLIDQFVQTYDSAARAALYTDLTTAILSGYHRINLTNSNSYFITSPLVCDFYPNTPALTAAALTRTWLATDTCE